VKHLCLYLKCIKPSSVTADLKPDKKRNKKVIKQQSKVHTCPGQFPAN